MTRTERFLKNNCRAYMKEGHALIVAEMNGDFPKAGAAGDGLACHMCIAALIRAVARQFGKTSSETLLVIEQMIDDVEVS